METSLATPRYERRPSTASRLPIGRTAPPQCSTSLRLRTHSSGLLDPPESSLCSSDLRPSPVRAKLRLLPARGPRSFESPGPTRPAVCPSAPPLSRCPMPGCRFPLPNLDFVPPASVLPKPRLRNLFHARRREPLQSPHSMPANSSDKRFLQSPKFSLQSPSWRPPSHLRRGRWFPHRPRLSMTFVPSTGCFPRFG